MNKIYYMGFFGPSLLCEFINERDVAVVSINYDSDKNEWVLFFKEKR